MSHAIDAKTMHHRIDLVRDTLRGITYQFPDPEVLLYPFLDCVMLLHQQPLVPAIWQGNKCSDAFLNDPAVLGEYQGDEFCRYLEKVTPMESRIAIGDSDYGLSIHKFPENPAALNSDSGASVDANATAWTRTLLTGIVGQDTKFFKSLSRAIDRHIERKKQPRHNQTTVSQKDLPENEIERLLAPMRVVLDEVFADLDDAVGPLVFAKEGLECPGIFAVIRTYSGPAGRFGGRFDYTARLFLHQTIKDRLANWCGTKCLKAQDRVECPLGFTNGKQCISALEQPLGRGARSIADLVFSSGITSFGRTAGESNFDASENHSHEGETADDVRRKVERCVYPEARSLIYSPIHVGGAPWLALFTLTPEGIDPWYHNYSFYRNTVQKLAGIIRLRSRAVYLDLVAGELVDHLSKYPLPLQGTEFVSAINETLRNIAQVYPFPYLQLERQAPGTGPVFSLPPHGGFNIRQMTNPFFQEQVSWGKVDLATIVRHCRERVHHYGDLRTNLATQNVTQTTHLLNSPLQRMAYLAALTGNEQLVEQAKRIRILHDAAMMTLNPAKRQKMTALYRSEPTLFHDFEKIVEERYRTCRDFLINPANRINRSERLKDTLTNLSISTALNVPSSSAIKVRYFDPLLTTVLDGLLLNAADHHPSDVDYFIRVRLVLNGKDARLVVENRTSADDLLVSRLNSPGPDMVGVTNLHWMATGFWPDDSDRLYWSLEKDGDRQLLRASALIAKVEI